MKPVDLQLPKQEFVPLYVPSVPVVPSERRFKEKVITRLDAEITSKDAGTFKKRKIAGQKQRNTRQRLDDD